jgi:hypothetical protein
MDCREVESRVEDGVPLGAEAEAHLVDCEACRGLASAGPELPRALSGLGQVAAPDLSAIEAGVRADLAAETGLGASVRSWARGARMLLVVGLLGLDALVFGTLFLRPDWDAVPLWRIGVVLAAHALVLLVAMWEAMRPVHRPARSGAQTVALVAVSALLPAAFLALPELPTPMPFSYFRVGCLCFGSGVAQAVVLLLLLGLIDRSGGRLRPFLFAAVAGGLLGQIGLTLHCAINDRWHLLSGHATVPLGLLLGVLALRRRLR